MSARLLFFTPADMVVRPGDGGVRAVLPTLDLARRRGAALVLLWDREEKEAPAWSHALGGVPYLTRGRMVLPPGFLDSHPRGGEEPLPAEPPWEEGIERLRSLFAGEGEVKTVGIGRSADEPWLSLLDRRVWVAEGTAWPGGPTAWRWAVEEALASERV